MPIPRADRKLVHNIAVAAMGALLSNKSSRAEVSLVAKNKRNTFQKQLAISSYDIAIAIIEEGDSRT